MNQNNEQERVEKAFDKWSQSISPFDYSYFNQGNLYIVQGRERAALKLLAKHGYSNLSEAKILDVGCGGGGELRGMLRYGGSASNLYGIDIIPERVREAQAISPNINVREGSATDLPFDAGYFDMALLFTVFTSIPDTQIKQKAAMEILRVLKPGGIILWYDFRYLNPRNKHAKQIKADEIRALFPGCGYDIRSITLLPPLARRLAPFSFLLCYLLEKIPFMRSHYIAVIRKI